MPGSASLKEMYAFIGVFIAGFALCASHSHHSHDPDSEEHYIDGDHNPHYDRDAFVGGEEDSEEFTKLAPEEQIKRLRGIMKKIDTDSDDFLTQAELSSWIQKSFVHYVNQDAQQQFVEYDRDGDGLVSWEEYNLQMYDHVIDFDEKTPLDDYEEESFRQIHLKDKKRYEHADRDAEIGLNVAEFTDFEHPEQADHMRAFVIEGALDEHDKDGDGFVSLEEFLGDYRRDSQTKEDPEWILVEKDRFVNDYDKDGDGQLNPDELLLWVTPNNEGIANEEANHVVEEIDMDGDGKLTEAEVIENLDMFLASEATDYGRQLQQEHFYHDEL